MKIKNKVRVVFYMRPEDVDILKAYSQSLDIDNSQFIRNAVLEKLGRPTFKSNKCEMLNTASRTVVGQLFKIGNNLNQIAKKLNSGTKLLIEDESVMLSAIDALKVSIIEISNKLKK